MAVDKNFGCKTKRPGFNSRHLSLALLCLNNKIIINKYLGFFWGNNNWLERNTVPISSAIYRQVLNVTVMSCRAAKMHYVLRNGSHLIIIIHLPLLYPLQLIIKTIILSYETSSRLSRKVEKRIYTCITPDSPTYRLPLIIPLLHLMSHPFWMLTIITSIRTLSIAHLNNGGGNAIPFAKIR